MDSEIPNFRLITPYISKLEDVSKLEIDSIYIKPIGRFSNAFSQLSNAIYLAYKTGIKKIYIQPKQSIKSLFPGLDSFLCEEYGIQIFLGVPSYPGISLCGSFLYAQSNIKFIFNDMPPLRKIIKSFEDSTGFISKINNKEERQLCIHIRSGDIFENLNKKLPNPKYGQPPLSFYKLVIKDFSPKLVKLVYQDEKNPVIKLLKNYLLQENIPFQICSSKNLRDDINVLINAKYLVAGGGTFMNGVICLNNVVKTVYIFNKKLSRRFLPNQDQNESKILRVIDNKGEYIKNNEK